ncbi:3-deoxy-D-manno-octulosonic acid transferase [Rhodoferax sp.]|uniref:3-deoxy-D-manno-octulosonic acid transferase n=1 Tax=Rhodoferax sp. TaxID=50421 RepID=UPI0025E8F32E|nr:3-deoxy-D-manno-octulosonic acid transferase [Rhodoferax sp.]
MMRLLYSLLTWAAQPWVRRKLARRAKAEPLYGAFIEERFGYYDTSLSPTPDSTGPRVWLHAVSLGETRAAAVLVARLREQLPGMQLLLTHGTATGREAGKALLQPGDLQVWQPWDTPGAVGRFLARFRPAVGLLMETEVWPNLVVGCQKAGVPLCLVNARLSDKSLRQARRLPGLAGPAYRGLHAVWAQSEADAARLRSLGARVCGVPGNFKFDATPHTGQLEHGRRWRTASAKPVVMFASAREGEEQMLLDILKENRPLALIDTAQVATEKIANTAGNVALPVQLLVVPRHPQRFDEVERLFLEAGYTVSRRSQWTEATQSAQVWLGDSLGEMALYFGMAHTALLGGSFAPLGGQNLIEAAACGVPVFMGPHLFNFAEASTLAADAGAAQRCADIADAWSQACAVATDPAHHRTMADAALALGAAHRGAAAKTATEVAALLAR